MMILQEMKCPNCKDGTLGYPNPENNSKFHIKCCYCGYETIIPQSEVYIFMNLPDDDFGEKRVQLISHFNDKTGLIEVFKLTKMMNTEGEVVKLDGEDT